MGHDDNAPGNRTQPSNRRESRKLCEIADDNERSRALRLRLRLQLRRGVAGWAGPLKDWAGSARVMWQHRWMTHGFLFVFSLFFLLFFEAAESEVAWVKAQFAEPQPQVDGQQHLLL